MDIVERMEELLEAKASKNNTIDLNDYAQGMEDLAKSIKNNDSEVDITKPLKILALQINPMDCEGDFETTMGYHTHIYTKEAQQVIDYLTKSINEREKLKQ